MKRTIKTFRDFVRVRHPADVPARALQQYAASADFPAGEAWKDVRGFLVRAGAEHEAIVGARIAWRQFKLKEARR